MEAIQDAVRQKLREVLTIYGLPDGINGLLDEEILQISRTGELSTQYFRHSSIADFTAVHERRVEIGIDGDPPSFPMATNNDPSTTPLATPPATPSSTGNDHGTCPACRLTKRKSYVGMASAPKRRRKSSKRPDPEALANEESAEVQESSPAAALETLPSETPSAGITDVRSDRAPETLPAVIASAAVEERGSDSTPETLPNDTSSTGTMDISTDPALKPLSDGIAQTGVEEHSCVGPETLPNNIPSANDNTALASYGVVGGLHPVDSAETNILASDASTNQHCHPNGASIQTQSLGILGAELVPAIVSQPESLANNRDSTQPEQTGQTFQHLWSFISEMLNPEDAIRVMTSVILCCAAQREKAGKYIGRVNLQVSTDTTKIREHSRDLALCDFDSATDRVARKRAASVGNDIQNQSDESWYWDIISKGARTLDPTTLPAAKGPPDDFSIAEKIMTYKFMVGANYPMSDESQRQFRHYWKALFDFKNAGVGSMLYYRTPAFDAYCKKYPKTKEPTLLDTILSWEKVYRPQIDQLELRVRAQRTGDFSGRCNLQQKHVAEKLNISESSWNDASNDWYSANEENAFKLETQVIATSSRTTSELFYENADT
jgi:hypothetical protein